MMYSLFEETAGGTEAITPGEASAGHACEELVGQACGIDIARDPIGDVIANYAQALEQSLASLKTLQAIKALTYGDVNFDPFDRALRDLPEPNDVQRQMFEFIVVNAKESGLAADGLYEIHARDFHEYLIGEDEDRGYRRNHHAMVTDIEGLCRAISKRYGGENGRLIEYKRVAYAAIRTFNLRNQEVEEKGGTVSLKMLKYLRRNYRGHYEWDYSDKSTISQVLHNLKMIFGKAGMHLSTMELDVLVGPRGQDVEMHPGKTSFNLSAGDHHIRVKVFKDYLRWTFTKTCADVIADFVSEFGSEEE